MIVAILKMSRGQAVIANEQGKEFSAFSYTASNLFAARHGFMFSGVNPPGLPDIVANGNMLPSYPNKGSYIEKYGPRCVKNKKK